MSLFLPRWPIDRRCRAGRKRGERTDRPLALAASSGNRRVVTAVNEAAEAIGIAPGLPLADARALYPALAVAAADPPGDAAALARLARWCGRWSPWTVPEGNDGVWLDITGCAHLWGGEESFAREALERLEAQGIAARAAIADTPGAAWAMARCGGAAVAVVPPGGARAALASLPVRGLRLAPELAAELDRLGLRRIGDLYDLPRATLPPRFGPMLTLRLDQALGQAPEPLAAEPPVPPFWTRRSFAEPIATPEAIAAATGALLDTLCRRLGTEELGARRLDLALYRVDGARQAVRIGTARPSRDPRHLLRLFAERLAAIDPGLGIEDMMLAAPTIEKLAAAQSRLRAFTAAPAEAGGQDKRRVAASAPKALVAPVPRLRPGLSEESSPTPGTIQRDTPNTPLSSCPALGRASTSFGAGAADDLALLIDRLANRLGSDAVFRLVPRESHVPERAVERAPVFAPVRGMWNKAKPRPIRLLPRPEPIAAVALAPDDPPVQFHWRRQCHRLRRAEGPERILGEWWRGAVEETEPRDYYRVEDESGRRFWLYRSGSHPPQMPQRWFLHGLFA